MELISGVDIWNEFVIDFFGVFWMIVKNLVLLVVFFIVDFDFLLFLLGMDQFLYDVFNQCVRIDVKYTFSINGWKNGVLLVYC